VRFARAGGCAAIARKTHQARSRKKKPSLERLTSRRGMRRREKTRWQTSKSSAEASLFTRDLVTGPANVIYHDVSAAEAKSLRSRRQDRGADEKR